MRVMFCSTGGAGHLLPLLPLADALRARGHAIAWVSAPDALPRLAGRDFEAFAAGPDFEASRRQFRERHPEARQLSGERLSAFTFPRLFGALLAPAMLPGLVDSLRRWQPDCMVHEPAALAAPLACRLQGLPHVTQGYGLRPPADLLAAAMAHFGPLWRAHGLDVPADAGLYKHLYLDIVPPGLQPATAPEASRVLRFNPYHAKNASSAPPQTLPSALAAALQPAAARRPRIYLSFGTVFNGSAAMQVAARPAAGLGGTLVITTGGPAHPAGQADLPGCVHLHRFIDQRALLPLCDVVVSHGGAGTLLGAATHGLPQLLLPQAADHFRNARALAAAGAGVALAPAQQTEAQVAAALSALLADASRADGAARLAQELAALPDADATAAALEAWWRGTQGAGPGRPPCVA